MTLPDRVPRGTTGSGCPSRKSCIRATVSGQARRGRTSGGGYAWQPVPQRVRASRSSAACGSCGFAACTCQIIRNNGTTAAPTSRTCLFVSAGTRNALPFDDAVVPVDGEIGETDPFHLAARLRPLDLDPLDRVRRTETEHLALVVR